jgi:cytochrome c biogenesis protein CcdA
MDFGAGTYLLGYLAGVLSTLSPCVLPLLPILVAAAVSQHRFGPLALAGGLMLSFAGIGIFIATIGFSLGLDPTIFRQAAAVLLMACGVVLLSTRLQQAFASATGGLSNAGNGWLSRIQAGGWLGQFLVGLVLGVVWSPCVGPTLGAASTLAAQGSQLTKIALLMLVFGLGAGTPLVALGALSREAILRVRGKLLQAGQWGKLALSGVLLLLGLAILTGWDRRFEAVVTDHSPQWLVELTTRF